VCPRWLREKTEETYSYDTGTYTTVIDKKEDILKEIKWQYQDSGLEALMRWKIEGKLVWGRAIPKHKNIKQMRPIVSSCKTGYYRAGKITARCFTVLVKEVKRKSRLLNMGCVKELPDIINKLNRKKKGKQHLHTTGDIMMMKFDVKEQYTSLFQKELCYMGFQLGENKGS